MTRLLALFLLWVSSASPVLAGDLYLVRHAEKHTDGDADPGLTQAGLARARHLADLLADTGITRVFSTNYRRTRLTAAPLALDLNRDVEIYDPRDLPGFAEQLKSLEDNVLVVGHSNTTPALVQLLGGDPHGTIDESEYDRVYLVQRNGQATHTVLLRLPPRSGKQD